MRDMVVHTTAWLMSHTAYGKTHFARVEAQVGGCLYGGSFNPTFPYFSLAKEVKPESVGFTSYSVFIHHIYDI